MSSVEAGDSSLSGGGEEFTFPHASHVRYFRRFIDALPGPYVSLDTNRMMALYFCVSGLDLLGATPDGELRDRIISWVYLQQILPTSSSESGAFRGCGFTGGNHAGDIGSPYRLSHVSMTYTALATLVVLGDDLSRVDKRAVTSALRELQQESGVYQAVSFGTESDTRFVFCACAISFMLQDWSGVDVEKARSFLTASVGFDGGFGLLPGNESHGGATYTALASWMLLGWEVPPEIHEEILRFCTFRQIGGFNGRINKPPDTCYTFWVGGSLQMLGCEDHIDAASTRAFLHKCQHGAIGGFGKKFRPLTTLTFFTRTTAFAAYPL